MTWTQLEVLGGHWIQAQNLLGHLRECPHAKKARRRRILEMFMVTLQSSMNDLIPQPKSFIELRPFQGPRFSLRFVVKKIVKSWVGKSVIRACILAILRMFQFSSRVPDLQTLFLAPSKIRQAQAWKLLESTARYLLTTHHQMRDLCSLLHLRNLRWTCFKTKSRGQWKYFFWSLSVSLSLQYCWWHFFNFSTFVLESLWQMITPSNKHLNSYKPLSSAIQVL